MEYKSIEHINAVVVWFHPSEQDAKAIQAYNHEVDHVFVVDNSGNNNHALLTGIANATYIGLDQNKGIAAALNIGITEASKKGAEWILTMDQDSRWDQHSFGEYIHTASQYEHINQAGILSPYQDIDGMKWRHHFKGIYEQRNVIMCSGNLLRLKAWEQAGGFREDLFIDLVDDEICCHLKSLGWHIIRINTIYLSHHLGNGVHYSPILRHPFFTHATWRYFYIARNTRILIKLYPQMATFYYHEVAKHIKHLLLYDWEKKIAKLANFYQGWQSAKRFPE